MNMGSGASRLKSKCNGNYYHIVGRGDGTIMANLARYVAAGQLRAVIDRVFPLDEAPEALAHLQEGHCAGKTVVQIVADPQEE